MSTDNQANNKRIAKNTLLLYFRMLLTMAVTLYTSRVVLKVLGVEDFGIYNVVGGVVAMFQMLSGSLTAAITRFITFELGKGDFEKLKKVFSTSVNIQVLLSVIIVILIETVGVWFLNNKMVIPSDRLVASHWVLQFSIFTFVVNLISVPYNAAIIAHEKMSAFAYIGIIEVFLKLAVAFAIIYNPFDKLVYYGLLIFIIGLIIRLIYGYYCNRHFEETEYHFVLDKQLTKEMFGFAGWNFIGASSAILRDQGGNVLINLFYGPVVNAARGISMQVSSALGSFVTNFMTAVNPQITKSYASGDHDYMMKLVFQSTRFSFYIILFLALPIIVSAQYILDLWLEEVPDHTVNFVRLILTFSLFESLANPLITVMLATGNIKKYQLMVGGFQFMNLPVSYVLLRLGFAAESIIVVAIVISVICEITRLLMLKNMVNLPVKAFLIEVYFNALFVALLASMGPAFMSLYCDTNFINFILLSLVSFLSVLLVVYFIGFNSDDRTMVLNQLNKLKTKLFVHDKNN